MRLIVFNVEQDRRQCTYVHVRVSYTCVFKLTRHGAEIIFVFSTPRVSFTEIGEKAQLFCKRTSNLCRNVKVVWGGYLTKVE